MNDAIAIENPSISSVSMPKTKKRKEKVIGNIKEKLEKAKLDLIFIEMDEANIPYDKDITSIEELNKHLEKSLSSLNYNQYISIRDNVSKSLDAMVDSLEAGSTNAFTKLMTSDVSKEIGKSLGISLAGRSALILAPTIGTKAVVGAGLGCYGLYRVIKNRKEIIKANEENELNNILMDLETTKNGEEYVDTRFNEDIQEEIRQFLKNVHVEYDDTGYRSLREAIYSLDVDSKRSLCELLNTKLGKGIDVSNRVDKAKKKLNVVASTAANVGIGAGIGANVATAVNSIDPGVTAGLLNGTFLGAWIEKQTNNAWYATFSGGLGLIGTEVLQHIPFIGGVAQKVFATENLATFSAIGATGGLVVSGALTAASIVQNIHGHVKQNKETKKFIALDSEKYAIEDQKELELVRNKLCEPKNDIELVIIDIVMGYLKDENIQISGNPKSIAELNEMINKLEGEEKEKAKNLILKITNEINNDSSFVGQLQKAGKISIGLFTSGLAVMSVYDILKGGTFLPELSTKLFPNSNINSEVLVLPSKETPYDSNNSAEAKIFQHNQEMYNSFATDEYMTEQDGNLFDNLLKWIGIEQTHDIVPNIPEISAELNKLSPKQLYEFYRTYNTIQDDSELYEAIGGILSRKNYLEKVSNYINGFERTQQLNNLINDLSNKAATGMIPLAVALESLGIVEKNTTTDQFKMTEEVQSISK